MGNLCDQMFEKRVAQIIRSCPKSGHLCFYLRSDMFESALNVTKYLATIVIILSTQFKNAQSGHTTGAIIIA